MREHKYILDASRHPVPCADVMTWARWYEHIENRRVAHTAFIDGSRLSTVFLGMDHGWNEHRPPVLFETMLFTAIESNDDGGAMIARYATWGEAEAGHIAFVEQFNAHDVLPGVLLDAMRKKDDDGN